MASSNVTHNKLAVISVAMLKVNWNEQGKDYISYLEPFVTTALRDQNGQEITSVTTSRLIESIFGLKIPAATVELCLRRLVSKYLKKDKHRYWLEKLPPLTDFNIQRAFAQEHVGRTITALRNFYLSEYGTEWPENEALEALLIYLNQFGIECLSAFEGRSVLPEIKVTDPRRSEFRINSFIRKIRKDDVNAWESMTILVRSQMLANALLCPDLEAIQKNFSKVTFYLDTRLLLRLLGLEGVEELSATSELVRLLVTLGGNVSYFVHTAQELDRVISYSRKFLNSPQGKGSVIWHARATGLTDSDMALIQSTIKEKLNKFKIYLTPTPPFSKRFNLGELEFEEFLVDEIDGIRENAKQHDINSVRSIYELREGIAPSRLEDAKVVFVTSNGGLSRAAYRYGKKFASCREVSAVVTDYSLANVAWLKQPLECADVPVIEMLALAYAVIQPPAQLWERYLAEAEKLANDGTITPEAHSLLRYHLKAREELMNLTEGSEQEFSSATVMEILNHIENEIRNQERLKIAEMQKAHDETRSTLRQIDEAHKQQKKHVETLCFQWSSFIGWIVFVILAFALMTGTIIGSYYLSDIVAGNSPYKIPLIALTVFAVLCSIIGGLWGKSISDLQKAVARLVNGWLLRKFTPSK